MMELIDENQPDLIIMDLRLGKRDGLDLLREIRATYHDLPVIVCTAYLDFRQLLKSIEAGYVVTKNSDLSELKGTIREALDAGVQTSF